MISGQFGDNKELFFEIQLVAADGEFFFVEALFDTGFTDDWLAIDSQDLDALGWSLITSQIELVTARGEAQFDIYSGRVIIDGVDVTWLRHIPHQEWNRKPPLSSNATKTYAKPKKFAVAGIEPLP